MTADSDSDSQGLKLFFQLNDNSKLNEWEVTDHRGTDDTRDLMIAAGIGSRSYSFEVSDNYISDFDITVTHQHVGEFDLPPDDSQGYEVNQDPNEIMHTLLSDCSHLLAGHWSKESRVMVRCRLNVSGCVRCIYPPFCSEAE